MFLTKEKINGAFSNLVFEITNVAPAVENGELFLLFEFLAVTDTNMAQESPPGTFYELIPACWIENDRRSARLRELFYAAISPEYEATLCAPVARFSDRRVFIRADIARGRGRLNRLRNIRPR
jgi:hypothetical protein